VLPSVVAFRIWGGNLCLVVHLFMRQGHLLQISAYAATVCPPAEVAWKSMPGFPAFPANWDRVIRGMVACLVAQAGTRGVSSGFLGLSFSYWSQARKLSLCPFLPPIA
jgi:hypothetical protein